MSLFRYDDLSDFVKRNHHEVTLLHQRMGNLQVGLVDSDVVIEQNVDVDRTVFVLTFGDCAICAAYRIWEQSSYLFSTPHIAFNLLCQPEHLVWCPYRLAEDDGVEARNAMTLSTTICGSDLPSTLTAVTALL